MSLQELFNLAFGPGLPWLIGLFVLVGAARLLTAKNKRRAMLDVIAGLIVGGLALMIIYFILSIA